MEKVFVGKEATVLNGKCAGVTGMVVGADSESKTVEIRIEVGTYITTGYNNIIQD